MHLQRAMATEAEAQREARAQVCATASIIKVNMVSVNSLIVYFLLTSCSYITQIVTGVEVITGNCFPSVWEILHETTKLCFVISHSKRQRQGEQYNTIQNNNTLTITTTTTIKVILKVNLLF